MSEDPPYSYHLIHQNQPRRNNFSSEVEPNQVTIMAFSTESHHRLSGGSRINVLSFRPQVNESCQSDSLSFYDVYGRKERVEVLSKTFVASDIVKDETLTTEIAAQNCTAFEDSRFSTCENIESCLDPPSGGAFRTNTTSFVAIYKSVNVTGSLQLRGFRFSSNYY
ncbi:unnamed protein product [Orchesella dallaii]|uniref:Uncharacterized protein n=1 Tax=Orchesella dallaii TaxID=48710 RepID=A0ABP1PK41_9HEXA